MLKVQQVRCWHNIVTLDESWFYLSTDHELIWFPADGKVPEMERHTVHSEKLMLMIVWNSSGFHLINVLSKGFKFNATHYVTNILSSLADWRKVQAGGSTRRLIVHADNARPHSAQIMEQLLKQNRMKRAPHPVYSPNLAPSDFYLFGHVKQLLAGHEFPDAEALLEAVRAILGGIEKVTLERVFLAWVERLRKCIAIDGDYVSEPIFFSKKPCMIYGQS
jgi:histone-lysine N-methyltransferase SETMAR